jgi:hypothetical protein
VREAVRVVKTADGGGYRHKRKYKKAEAYNLVPQDVKRSDDAGQDVLNKFPRGTTHDAIFSVANRCY